MKLQISLLHNHSQSSYDFHLYHITFDLFHTIINLSFTVFGFDLKFAYFSNALNFQTAFSIGYCISLAISFLAMILASTMNRVPAMKSNKAPTHPKPNAHDK